MRGAWWFQVANLSNGALHDNYNITVLYVNVTVTFNITLVKVMTKFKFYEVHKFQYKNTTSRVKDFLSSDIVTHFLVKHGPYSKLLKTLAITYSCYCFITSMIEHILTYPFSG